MKFIKKFCCITTIIIYNIISVAASISDNDGSAFITKAEFDALKSSFQSQIDTYNQGIDSKIDTAIASYLSGIKIQSKYDLTSLINQVEPVFCKNKGFDQSHLGTYINYYISLCYGSWTNPAGSCFMYVFEGSTNAWYANVALIKNETDKEQLYNISVKTDANGTYYKVNYLQQSLYQLSTMGGAAGGRGSSLQDGKLYYLEPFTVTKGTLVNFGSIETTFKPKRWDGTTYTEDGWASESCVTTWGFTDEKLVDNTLDMLAGEQMDYRDNVCCMIDTEQSLIGEEFETVKTDSGASRLTYPSGTSAENITRPNPYADSLPLAATVKAYRHKYYLLSELDFVNESISNIVGEHIHFYEGCPMFKAPDDGTVNIKLKFENSGTASTIFEIKNAAFSNATVTGGARNIDECTNTNWTANDNAEVTFDFKVEKDKTYWIKALPASGNTKITTTKIEIETKKE